MNDLYIVLYLSVIKDEIKICFQEKFFGLRPEKLAGLFLAEVQTVNYYLKGTFERGEWRDNLKSELPGNSFPHIVGKLNIIPYICSNRTRHASHKNSVPGRVLYFYGYAV